MGTSLSSSLLAFKSEGCHKWGGAVGCRGVWGADGRVRKAEGIARGCRMTCMAHGNRGRHQVSQAVRFWSVAQAGLGLCLGDNNIEVSVE